MKRIMRKTNARRKRPSPSRPRERELSFEDRFAAVFGPQKGNLLEQVRSFGTHEKRIVAWLAASPDHVRAFREDPIGTLARQFPEIELPRLRREFPRLSKEIQIGVKPAPTADPVVQEIFNMLWAHVSQSQANTDGFKQNPFAVIATIGAGYPPDKVDAVNRAFEAVFGLRRITGGGEQPAFSATLMAALATLGGGKPDAHT